VKARHFGASSYDDEYDEEEEMDMSGFIGSTTTEQPPVIERKRAARVPPINEGLGNMGPRSVPPPQSNMGYTPSMVANAASDRHLKITTGEGGTPWNPLWAHDNTLGPNLLPVASKSLGLGALLGGAMFAAGSRQLKGVGGKMMVAGTAAYLHPALGLGHGAISNLMGDRAMWQIYGSSLLVNGIGGYAFYRILKM
jgi:hypothetical protein